MASKDLFPRAELCFIALRYIELIPGFPELSAMVCAWSFFNGYDPEDVCHLSTTAHGQAHAAMANGILGHTEFRLRMQPSVVLSTRGRLQCLRLQLALLDQKFDDLDYETLRALDVDNVPTTASMTDKEINALPVHRHKVAAPQSGSAVQQASSSLSPEESGQGGLDASYMG